MRTLKFTLEYEGTHLVGWQRQAEGRSVQGLLEDALARFEGGPVAVEGAGRTDAGVHALGQVASVRVSCAHDTATLARALNAMLPPDVRVVRVEEAADGFHARFDARSKTYRYQVRNAPFVSPFERAVVWHIPEPLSFEPMQAAAALVEGTHDFRAFQSTGGDVRRTERTIVRSELRRTAGLLVYEICGDGFLRHMVRALVGTLVEVGRGRRSPENLAALLNGAARGDAGPTAPPHGLFLVSVEYY